MEILVALCIVLIALVPPIHLHVTSIRMIDSGSHMANATLVANDRLAEILARDIPELGKSSGRVEDEIRSIIYRWTSTVTDTPVPQLESVRLMGIRQVHVDFPSLHFRLYDSGFLARTISTGTHMDSSRESSVAKPSASRARRT